MAVADARFKAHQEAYNHWYAIKEAIHQPDEMRRAVSEARQWWRKNCLYLDPKAREAFWKCMHQGSFYDTYYTHWRSASQGENKEKANADLLQAWDDIHYAGEVLTQCVALPGLADEEAVRPPEILSGIN